MRSKLSIWDCSCRYCLDFVWLSDKERNCYSTLIYIPHLLCVIYLPCYVLHDNPQRTDKINSLYWYLYIQQTLVSSSQMFSVNPSPPLSHRPVMNCLSKITCFPAVWASRMFQHLVVISGGWALTDVCPSPGEGRAPPPSIFPCLHGGNKRTRGGGGRTTTQQTFVYWSGIKDLRTRFWQQPVNWPLFQVSDAVSHYRTLSFINGH